jgi:hypothetical protein
MLQGLTKLHGLLWCEPNGFVVQVRERRIHNEAGSPIMLRHDAQRRDAEVWPIRYRCIGQHQPMALATEVQHFVTDELELAV